MTADSEWDMWWARQGEEELRLILWAAWDPIGGVPRDEYHRYVPQVASLLRRGASSREIAEYLGKTRTETIGVEADPIRDLEVAYKIDDWYDDPSLSTPYPRPSELK